LLVALAMVVLAEAEEEMQPLAVQVQQVKAITVVQVLYTQAVVVAVLVPQDRLAVPLLVVMAVRELHLL
jgi:hypothetical protein